MRSECGADFTTGKAVLTGVTCGKDMICCERERLYRTNRPRTCGFSNTAGAGFYDKATGNNAEFAEFPWMASIEEGTKKICTGSLIDEKLVMTSAACVKDKKLLKIRLGSWRTTKDNTRPETEEMHEVERTIIDSNIALLVMKTPARRNMYINQVCLADREDTTFNNCSIVGWGIERPATGDLMTTKTKAGSCELVKNLNALPRTMCGVSKVKYEEGACLVCEITHGIYRQVGLAFYADSDTTTPMMFARIPDYRKFIDDESRKMEMKPERYTYSKTKVAERRETLERFIVRKRSDDHERTREHERTRDDHERTRDLRDDERRHE
jgi:hypothetical protein